MSDNTSSSEGLTQLQAELAEFHEVLREHNVDLNPSRYISLTPEEYEDSWEVLQEFLTQEGFGLEPENNPPLQHPDNVQDDAISLSSGQPPPGQSAAEMDELYLADVDVEVQVEPFMELNLEPDCDLDLGALELDDLFSTEEIESSTIAVNNTDVLAAEKPHSPENVLVRSMTEVIPINPENIPPGPSDILSVVGGSVGKPLPDAEISSVMKRKRDRKEKMKRKKAKNPVT